MLRIIPAVAVASLLSSTPVPAARLDPAFTAWASGPAEPVDALHRTGEELFDAGDYAGARAAWTRAYERTAPDESTWPYRTTLLSLIVTTALSELSERGDRAAVREAADLIDAALSSQIDDETRASLEEEQQRLSPYLAPLPTPAQTPPPADDGPPRDLSQDSANNLIASPVWMGSGGALLAAGITALVVGSRFGPRATNEVMRAGDSTTMAPGSVFISEERRKGTAWMVTGGAIAAVGVTALVIGIVRLTRDRKR